jgi:GT2 family glycosyltransferase
MSAPLLSILLPFRNAASTLADCLDSIVNQSLDDFELLAIDDASTDDSRRICGRYAASDSRIRVTGSNSQGIVAALNCGLAQARADIVVRMDADDLMRPGRLEAHFRHFGADPSLTLSATRVRFFPEENLRAGYREYLRWQNAVLTTADVSSQIFVESPFAHPAVAFRRQTIQTLGGYRQGAFPEDYDLWLRLFRHGLRMAKIPEVLLDWRDSGSRLSRTDPRYSREAFDRLRATHLARDPRLRNRQIVIWGAGRRTRRRAGLLLGQGFVPQAWIDIDPRKIGNRIQGIAVRPPDALAVRERPFVLVYVTNHGARDCIAKRLDELDYRAGRDYLMVG